jgi:hypothetical protein
MKTTNMLLGYGVNIALELPRSAISEADLPAGAAQDVEDAIVDALLYALGIPDINENTSAVSSATQSRDVLRVWSVRSTDNGIPVFLAALAKQT